MLRIHKKYCLAITVYSFTVHTDVQAETEELSKEVNRKGKKFLPWEIQSIYANFLLQETKRARAQTEQLEAHTELLRLQKKQLEAQLELPGVVFELELSLASMLSGHTMAFL